MLVSLRHRIVILSMPKTATTSIDHALSPLCEMVFRQNPRIKHLNYRKFKRLVGPLLERAELRRADVEVICLMRDPSRWVSSWYRYLSQKHFRNNELYTGDMTYQEYIEKRTVGKDEATTNQINFLLGFNGKIGVDRLFRMEDDDWKTYLSAKFGQEIEFPYKNVTRIEETEVIDLRTVLPLHYQLYDSLRPDGLVAWHPPRKTSTGHEDDLSSESSAAFEGNGKRHARKARSIG